MYNLSIQPIMDDFWYMRPNKSLIDKITNDTNIEVDISGGPLFYYVTVKTDEEYLYIKLKYSELNDVETIHV